MPTQIKLNDFAQPKKVIFNGVECPKVFYFNNQSKVYDEVFSSNDPNDPFKDGSLVQYNDFSDGTLDARVGNTGVPIAGSPYLDTNRGLLVVPYGIHSMGFGLPVPASPDDYEFTIIWKGRYLKLPRTTTHSTWEIVENGAINNSGISMTSLVDGGDLTLFANRMRSNSGGNAVGKNYIALNTSYNTAYISSADPLSGRGLYFDDVFVATSLVPDIGNGINREFGIGATRSLGIRGAFSNIGTETEILMIFNRPLTLSEWSTIQQDYLSVPIPPIDPIPISSTDQDPFLDGSLVQAMPLITDSLDIFGKFSGLNTRVTFSDGRAQFNGNSYKSTRSSYWKSKQILWNIF